MAGYYHRPTATFTADATTTYAAVVEVIRRLQTVGHCLDLDTSVQPTSVHISPLFHRLLSVFLTEIDPNVVRPPPHAPQDGRPVDLFKLFCCVRGKGGYDAVTAAKTWSSVAKETGFGTSAASAVKLLYSKHLLSMERWLAIVLSKKGRRRKVVEKETEECETPRELKTKVLWTPTQSRQPTVLEAENGEGPESGNEVVVEEGPTVGCNTGHMKRVGLVEMVKWVRSVARRPWHPSSSVKVNGKSECVSKDAKHFKQVLLVRKAVFMSYSNNGSSLPLKRQRPHPSIYEDHVNADHEANKKLRCSERILGRQSNGRLESDLASNVLRSCNSRGFSNNHHEEQVSPDPCPHYRARVPPWTGKKVSSDFDSTRWLGTRIWPPNAEKKSLAERDDPIGKGREDNCLCEHRGSLECVRFHVAEKRLRLKREICSAFYHWKFNKMGEEVALSWKEEEERKFKSIVRQSQHTPDKSFWEQLYLGFPYKSRQNLVSYYFDVFLLRRRGYQNRVTPESIDSDDEEPEFGFLSQPLGHNAITDPNLKPVLCSQNEQCVELDELTGIDD